VDSPADELLVVKGGESSQKCSQHSVSEVQLVLRDGAPQQNANGTGEQQKVKI